VSERGIFAPTIAVGIGFGRFLCRNVIYPWHLGSEHVLTAHEPLVAVLSATAYFAGVTHSPMTAFAVMAGLFSTTSSVVTAMLVAAVLGWLSSRLVAPRPLYGALSAKLPPPLPPESLECDPQALPPPHYVPRGVSARRAQFVEVSERLPSAPAGGRGPRRCTDIVTSESELSHACVSQTRC